VRTPWQIERGLKDDNWFLREIIAKGKVLYEMTAALRHVDESRRECRGRLKLSLS